MSGCPQGDTWMENGLLIHVRFTILISTQYLHGEFKKNTNRRKSYISTQPTPVPATSPMLYVEYSEEAGYCSHADADANRMNRLKEVLF